MSTAAQFESPEASSGAAARLVVAMVARDAGALGELYDSYAPRLYTYACGLLGDRQLAADVVHDTVLVAYERCGQLREPDKLTAWLYAICRNECRRLQRNSRRESLVDEVPIAIEVSASATDGSEDFGGSIDAQEARSLVESSLPALSTGDREVLELSLRHGLDAAAVAEVMGVSVNNARARMARARSVLEQSVGALLVLKSPEQCDDLSRDAGTLAETGGVLTALTRKRVVRHLKACPGCAKVRSRAVKAVAVVTLPLLAAPIWLRDETIGQQLTAAQVDSDAIPFDRKGWPKSNHKGRNTTAIAAGVAGLLVVIGTGAVVAADSGLQGVAAMNATAESPAGASSRSLLGAEPMGRAVQSAPTSGDLPPAVEAPSGDHGAPASNAPEASGASHPKGAAPGQPSDPQPQAQAPGPQTGGSQANIYTGPPAGWKPSSGTAGTPSGKKPTTPLTGKPAGGKTPPAAPAKPPVPGLTTKPPTFTLPKPPKIVKPPTNPKATATTK